jgi:hypothetical protein
MDGSFDVPRICKTTNSYSKQTIFLIGFMLAKEKECSNLYWQVMST